MKCLKKAGKDPQAPWIVLLHGFGANPEDLGSLADQMSPSRELNWLFPEGPLKVNEGPGSRAWFRIHSEDLEKLKSSDPGDSASESRPPGLKKARLALQAELKKLGVPWSKIILGGFSQGGMTAMELALQLDEKPAGLLLFSSGLIGGEVWEARLKAHKELRVFQSHGREDQVISFAEACKLQKLIEQSGLKLQFESFHGGHELPPEIIQKAKAFIKENIR